MIEYAKDDAVHSLPLGSLCLGGSVGKKFEKVIYERMTSQKAHEKIFAEAADFLEYMDYRYTVFI